MACCIAAPGFQHQPLARVPRRPFGAAHDNLLHGHSWVSESATPPYPATDRLGALLAPIGDPSPLATVAGPRLWPPPRRLPSSGSADQLRRARLAAVAPRPPPDFKRAAGPRAFPATPAGGAPSATISRELWGWRAEWTREGRGALPTRCYRVRTPVSLCAHVPSSEIGVEDEGSKVWLPSPSHMTKINGNSPPRQM